MEVEKGGCDKLDARGAACRWTVVEPVHNASAAQREWWFVSKHEVCWVGSWCYDRLGLRQRELEKVSRCKDNV